MGKGADAGGAAAGGKGKKGKKGAKTPKSLTIALPLEECQRRLGPGGVEPLEVALKNLSKREADVGRAIAKELEQKRRQKEQAEKAKVAAKAKAEKAKAAKKKK